MTRPAAAFIVRLRDWLGTGAMLHASTQKLIIKICELTDQGAIAWKEGQGERPSSRFESEGYVIEVAADPPTVRVLGADGRELEHADDAELAATPWIGGDGTFATHVVSMASRAHRVARGAEAAISRILSSLSAPPQRMLEPAPSPAAPEFETAPARQPALAARAAESEAAMAAIAADMETLRRDIRTEPPPQSHSAPEPALQSIVPEPPHPVSAPELLASTAPPAPAPLEPEPPPAPAPAIAESVVEAPKEAAKPAPEPEPLPMTAAPPVTQRPVFRPDSSPVLAQRPPFGATPSFSLSASTRPKFNPNPAPKPAPQPGPPPMPVTPKLTPTKVTSGGLLFTGISAITRQTVRGEQLPDAEKPVSPAVSKPEPIPERPRAIGADIYKPWV